MSIFDRRPQLRWAVPVAAGALIVAGTLAGTVAASADSGLPPRTAEELLVALQAPRATAVSGTVVTTADLGLPELPAMGHGSTTDPTALISGSHTLRVWFDGRERTRVAMIGSAQEYDVVRDAGDVWTWSSSGAAADHYVLPKHDPQSAPDPAASGIALPSTPQEAAALVLKQLDGTTAVTTSGVSKVAGRSVYELILTPKQSGTLVARVVVAMDAETSVPLRVQVFSTQLQDPAYEVGFTSVDFSQPDPSIFAFTPPPGATVTDHAAPSDPSVSSEPMVAPEGMGQPTVIGTGWSQVVIATLPADMASGLADGSQDGSAAQAMTLLQSLPVSSGAWGTGRILNGTLFSAILTDDGRVAIGAVAPEALGAALAAQ
jgi:hypothetical protein